MSFVTDRFDEYFGEHSRVFAGPNGVDVVQYVDEERAWDVLLTDGLCASPLYNDAGDQYLVIEFLLMTSRGAISTKFVQLLLAISETVAGANRAIESGAVFREVGTALEGSSCVALMAYETVYFPEKLRIIALPTHPHLVTTRWLIPITARELAFLDKYGVDALSTEFVLKRPDLFDIGRGSAV